MSGGGAVDAYTRTTAGRSVRATTTRDAGLLPMSFTASTLNEYERLAKSPPTVAVVVFDATVVDVSHRPAEGEY